MKAVIMVGGRGTRLRPLTCDLPKPMVPIANRPVMEFTVELLKKHGFTEIVVTLCYLPEVVRAHFGDGSAFGVRFHYVTEETPLGTAGSVRNARRFLDGTFLVVSGDALTDFDLTSLVRFHERKGAPATLALTRTDLPVEYGVAVVDEAGRVCRFLEKPGWGEVFSDLVNTGIYVLEPEVLDHVDAGREFDFSRDLFPLLLSGGNEIFGRQVSGYWSDIGSLDDYRRANGDVLAGRVEVSLPGWRIGENIWIGEGSEIHPQAVLQGPVLIGRGCHIGRGARVEPFSVVGDGVRVGEGASLKRSIVWANAYVGRQAELRGAVLCGRAQVKAKACVFEGAVVGTDSGVGQAATLKPGVKVWPGKAVRGGTVLTGDLVWGGRSPSGLFTSLGVSGVVNLEVTPEFAAKLGGAFGAWVGEGRRVGVSSDAYGHSRMVRRALLAGILSAGVDVFDLGSVTGQVLRHAVASLGLSGGAHVRSSPVDAESVLIELLDERGTGLERAAQRKVENALFSEDFHRAQAAAVGRVMFAPNVVADYLERIVASVARTRRYASPYKLVVSCDWHNLSFILSELLGRLGCQLIATGPVKADGMRPVTFEHLLDSVPEVSAAVVREGADIGAVLDGNADRMVLIDERGSPLTDEVLLALAALAAFRSREGRVLAVPVTAPRAIEHLAGAHGGKVFRAKGQPAWFMAEVIEEKILIGGRRLPRFRPVSDALAVLAGVVGLMAERQAPLSALVRDIPEFHMAARTADCPWEIKGRVMRALFEECRGRGLELTDGIKVYHEHGWALVLPDAELPLFRVYSEAGTREEADALSELYMRKIKDIRTRFE